MPMSWIIKAENIGKKYIISHQKKQRYQTIQEETIKLAKKGVKKILSPFISKYRDNTPRKEDFWALKDVNFEIEQGDRVGIIGRNGAGKSTLLKILSRITEPTTGKFTAKGRIASLLEVGTGFHPELTGRENIFLNGSILGMSRAEIKKKFDEIVAFAEVEKFLDTPVKRYSSGMYVRLAFAVAAHLEPEILIVDEVLAVGDAQFQKKCLGKMEEVSKGEGRTVLFVSHNMGAIQNLCNKAIYLNNGSLFLYDETNKVIKKYLANQDYLNNIELDLRNIIRKSGHKRFINKVWLENEDGIKTNIISMGSKFKICFSYKLDKNYMNLGFGIGINSLDGIRLSSLNNYILSSNFNAPLEGTVYFDILELPIMFGDYNITLSIVENNSNYLDLLEGCYVFSVIESDIYNTGKLLTKSQGLFYLKGAISIK